VARQTDASARKTAWRGKDTCTQRKSQPRAGRRSSPPAGPAAARPWPSRGSSPSSPGPCSGPGNVVFATVDLAQPAFDALDEAWDVRTVPTFVVLVGGRPVRKLEGLQHKRPARLLAKALREVLETMPADEAGRGR